MRIDPKGEIAGLPALAVRDLLKKSQAAVSRESAQSMLGVDAAAVDRLLAHLEAEGYLERSGGDRSGIWQVTLKGGALANASAQRPMTRAAADKLLDELLARVEEVNRSSEYLYRVGEMAVFGSYLGGGGQLSDLDIGFTLVDRYEGNRQFEAMVRRADESGRRFSNIVERYAYAFNEVLRFLKAKKARISLHDMAEVRQLGFPFRLVYTLQEGRLSEQEAATPSKKSPKPPAP